MLSVAYLLYYGWDNFFYGFDMVKIHQLGGIFLKLINHSGIVIYYYYYYYDQIQLNNILK